MGLLVGIELISACICHWPSPTVDQDSINCYIQSMSCKEAPCGFTVICCCPAGCRAHMTFDQRGKCAEASCSLLTH